MIRIGLLVAAVGGCLAADLRGRPNPPPAVPGANWLGAGPPATVRRTQYPEQVPVKDTRPLVLVLDGAGDLRGCSRAMANANLQAGGTIEVAVFPWSHDRAARRLDQIDAGHAREQGKRFAAAVRGRQAREPGRRVVVVAHSAGCAVALAAGDMLPADALDRTILLAPSVSVGYDIRPSLRAAREGVDVFCSKKDWVALGFVTRVVGTTDKFGAPAAGRNGFRAPALDESEVPLLRQHFWTPSVAWSGHTGGHHGMYAPTFLHAYLFPLIGAPVR